MAETLPRFEPSDHSPKLPGEASDLAVRVAPAPTASETVVRGSWRVAGTDRAVLPPGALRPRIWLVAIGRESRLVMSGRPGGDAILFGDDEAPSGAVEGWFHVSLGECCRIPEGVRGLFDVFAVLGPWKSPAIEVLFK